MERNIKITIEQFIEELQNIAAKYSGYRIGFHDSFNDIEHDSYIISAFNVGHELVLFPGE